MYRLKLVWITLKTSWKWHGCIVFSNYFWYLVFSLFYVRCWSQVSRNIIGKTRDAGLELFSPQLNNLEWPQCRIPVDEEMMPPIILTLLNTPKAKALLSLKIYYPSSVINTNCKPNLLNGFSSRIQPSMTIFHYTFVRLYNIPHFVSKTNMDFIGVPTTHVLVNLFRKNVIRKLPRWHKIPYDTKHNI